MIDKDTQLISEAYEDIKKLHSNPTQKRVCPECKGVQSTTHRIKNLGTLDYVDSSETCNTCRGKGYITQEDIDRYYHNVGVGSCPQCKLSKKQFNDILKASDRDIDV